MGVIMLFLGYHLMKRPYVSSYLNNVDAATLITALVRVPSLMCCPPCGKREPSLWAAICGVAGCLQ